MSSFGGRSNYRGGSRNNNYRGGGRGRSSSKGGRGRSGHSSNHGKFNICKDFTMTGNCSRGQSCQWAHVVRFFSAVDASNAKQQDKGNSRNNYNNGYNNYNNNSNDRYNVVSIAVWESAGQIKIFTGSEDGYWRLWNAQNNFAKEYESNMQGEIRCLKVTSDKLVCGFASAPITLPYAKAGMTHIWNLQQPNNPPLELYMEPNHMRYAHNQLVTALWFSDTMIISGSSDGAIRVWAPQGNGFSLAQTMVGHAGEVTGLECVNNILWSAGKDGAIRIWDIKEGKCQHTIAAKADGASTPPASNTSAAQTQGHKSAVECLVSFNSPAGTFIISGGGDVIKAWNATSGECVMSESTHNGVTSLCLAKDQKGRELLLVGLRNGSIQCRNLIQTDKTPAFATLFSLHAAHTAGHNGPCRCIIAGPSGTFYSGGEDGKMLVFQISAELDV